MFFEDEYKIVYVVDIYLADAIFGLEMASDDGMSLEILRLEKAYKLPSLFPLLKTKKGFDQKENKEG